jgi:hypothetical protein
MTTPDYVAPSSMPMLILGGSTCFVALVLVLIALVGLRALAQGRDDVCVFSWRFPLELRNYVLNAVRSVVHLRELPAILSTLRFPDAAQYTPPSGIMRSMAILSLRISFFFLRRKLKPVRPRQAIQTNHYQTYGARMRARQQAA